MNCFRHQSAVAVGVCRSCGKALCPHCAAEVENGLACRDSCEARVNLINRMIDANVRNLQVADSHNRSTGILVITFGALFLAISVVCYAQNEEFLTMVLGTAGTLFLIFGFMWKKANSKPARATEPD
ncbi:MAG: hypothetical protein EXS05_09210 [Planctomycetaceae bacterium]|nr:hypothetical protein [Planctomycetaceae bacterium]